MEPPLKTIAAFAEALACARQIAHQFACDHAPYSSALSSLVQTCPHAQRVALIHALQDESLTTLDTSPNDAAALAHVAHALAQTQDDVNVTASAALALANALNRLGEFQDALQSAQFAASASSDATRARAECAMAWAHTYIGALGVATQCIARLPRDAEPLVIARGEWIKGLMARDQGDLPAALAHLEHAHAAFLSAAQWLDAARCERDMAYTYLRRDDEQGIARLANTRQTFAAAGCRLDVAHCDYLAAGWWLEHDRLTDSFDMLTSARVDFTACHADFFVALCDNDLGIAYWYREQFDQAVTYLCRARDYFRAHQIPKQISTTDINLGAVYYVQNRYADALAAYQEAAELALGEGRATRAARIWNNMAMVHVKQGRYDQAVDLFQRALQSIAHKEQDFLAAGIHSTLAACYRDLGQMPDALNHLRVAEQAYRAAGSLIGELSVNLALAEMYLARGDRRQAIAPANRARVIAVAEKRASFVALSDRLLAQTVTRQTELTRALKRLASARAVFVEQNKPVDAALCDLIQGELQLAWHTPDHAQASFERAAEMLSPYLPDLAWRVEYGLARCARERNATDTAKAHLQNAVRFIATTRAQLGTEEFSNNFFAARREVYDHALTLALASQDALMALDIIEASKARAFLALLHQQGWQVPPTQDAYVADLVAREGHLRNEMARLRAEVITQAANITPTLRGDTTALDRIQKLDALGQEYETVVTQLRLAQPGLAGVAILTPFGLAQFRAAMTQTYGDDWCALDYVIREAQIIIICVTPHEVQVYPRTVSGMDARTLEQCASLEPDMRELIYRGTLRGVPAPAQGKRSLQILYRLLIPPHLRARTLIISPHGMLHALPFHALLDGDTYLAEKCAIVYTPSLQVAQHLVTTDTCHAPNMLALGLSEFGGVMPPLPYAEREAHVARATWQAGATRIGKDASRAEMMRLNATGELRQFDVIHLATHALLDRAAPHQSRVLLADEPLTAFDVLGLSLDARLVTLSACQTALGKGGAGDEWIGLTRAFFYAGARALLATLWHVEDDSTGTLVTHIYTKLQHGEPLARAVQLAQIEMIHAGHPPFQWAAFALMGHG